MDHNNLRMSSETFCVYIKADHYKSRGFTSVKRGNVSDFLHRSPANLM